LITARLATEAGREVMAVPGSPLDPRAQGCNSLIRDGATLVQSAADVMETLTPLAGRVASPRARFEPDAVTDPADADDAARRTVEELLGPSPAPVDEIVRLSGLASGAVQMVLLELDLASRLDRHAGGKVSLR
jgi:DNA processing protein